MRLGAMTAAAVLLAAGCLGQTSEKDGKGAVQMSDMVLASPAFVGGGKIPGKFTCDGENISPPLKITGVPNTTRSLALIVDDPDAPGGDWVHWVMWNIRPDTAEIPEAATPSGAVQGLTDFRENRWGGPCPPSGTHRYFFKLYALDTTLKLQGSATKADLLAAMSGHIIGQTQLTGKYKKK